LIVSSSDHNELDIVFLLIKLFWGYVNKNSLPKK